MKNPIEKGVLPTSPNLKLWGRQLNILVYFSPKLYESDKN